MAAKRVIFMQKHSFLPGKIRLAAFAERIYAGDKLIFKTTILRFFAEKRNGFSPGKVRFSHLSILLQASEEKGPRCLVPRTSMKESHGFLPNILNSFRIKERIHTLPKLHDNSPIIRAFYVKIH